MNVQTLLCKNLREKPETKRASRKMGNIDFSRLIRMGLNENAWGVSPKALAAMDTIAPLGNFYQDWTQKDLKGAIGERFGVTSDYIVTGCGSSSLTEALGTAFLESGDELILEMPTFPAIIDTAQMNGASVKIVEMGEDLTYDLDKLLAAITDKTKMVYICNPNNPTGTYVPHKKMLEFARKCPDHVIQVYDEAYIEYADSEDCKEMTDAMLELKDKPIVLLKTFSKFFAMAGIRCGYILAQPEIVEWLSKCGTQFAVSKISQAGAAAAMRDEEHMAYVKEQCSKCRKYLLEEMDKLGCRCYPSETNFIFFYPGEGIEPTTVSEMMMEKGIMISAQAGGNRVSLGTMEQCEKYIEYLTEILGELKEKVVA